MSGPRPDELSDIARRPHDRAIFAHSEALARMAAL